MATKIGGVILRAISKKETIDFYTNLGVSFNEHVHGGPVHFEAVEFSAKAVLEIYGQSQNRVRDALILEVESISNSLNGLLTLNIKPQGETKETSDMKYVYVTDPDGRDVMLLERND